MIPQVHILVQVSDVEVYGSLFFSTLHLKFLTHNNLLVWHLKMVLAIFYFLR